MPLPPWPPTPRSLFRHLSDGWRLRAQGLAAALAFVATLFPGTMPARTSPEGPRTLQKFPMTAGGLQRLEEELRNLKSVERPAIIVAIAEARSHGDLSENAEYHAARERQSFIEGRIEELEAVVSGAEVIDPSQLSGDSVKFGAQVNLVDEETENERSYQIVGVYEADIKQGLLSISSPLAKALIGKKIGDTVSVPAPGGDKSYAILGVRYA